MKHLRRLSQIALFLSSLAFARNLYFGNDSNWSPVQLPVPGPGLEVSSPFHISTKGAFELQLNVPRHDTTSLDEPPPLSCDLKLEIKSAKGEVVGQSIHYLSFVGRSDMNIYASSPIDLLKAGDFIFELHNQGKTDFLSGQSAQVIFTRFDHPTEWYLGNILLRGLGWTLLIFGVMASIFFEISEIKMLPK